MSGKKSNKGRKKHPRSISFDPNIMACQCFGPLGVAPKNIDKIILTKAELQTLVDRDIDKIIMDKGSQKMGISKTVYAGIYASARTKLTTALITSTVLQIQCDS